jgi:ring-1,2-phenylacetyl-CoA epoxidase subunit PaaC
MTTADDNPYDLLAEDHDEGHRWAFGTGFNDPLAGIDSSVPPDVDAAALARCCLALGDDALIYSHRLQQWVTRMPELEEETAVANVALDLLGQARLLLARAGGILGRTEDDLAFFRAGPQFRNVRLAEHADRDFAELVGRLLIFSTWRLALFEALAVGAADPVLADPVLADPVLADPVLADPVLAAIAAKGINEVAYHRDYAARWVIRLGDGTALSHARMQAALDALWPLVPELFRPDPDAPVAADAAAFDAVIDTVLTQATLGRPRPSPLAPAGGRAGRDGLHTKAMAGILAELQSVARAHPDATW